MAGNRYLAGRLKYSVNGRIFPVKFLPKDDYL